MEKYVDEEKQELDNNTELNLGQIRSMLDEIESMTVEEHQNIIKILADNNVKSMENENGLFVKMNQLSIEVIKSIYEYVGVVRESKKDLETAIQSMEPVRDIINKNVPTPVPIYDKSTIAVSSVTMLLRKEKPFNNPKPIKKIIESYTIIKIDSIIKCLLLFIIYTF